MNLFRYAAQFIPGLKFVGINHVAAAGKEGVSVQSKTLVAGGTTLAVTLDFPMEDTDYQVAVIAESAGVTLDPATKTKTGFTLGGTVNAESVDVVVVGRLAGQHAE
jgi:hypothetical protein